MEVVALMQLATTADVEAPLLASDLGITAYEARQKLAVGMPCVVVVSAEHARVASLLASLGRRGHDVLACEGSSVIPSQSMCQVRRFRFEPDALVLQARQEGPPSDQEEERVAYAAVSALIRATHRHTFEAHEESKERKFRPVAAVVTGGLMLTKTVTRDVVRVGEDREQVLYIFRRNGGPCLLREGIVQYGGLGADIRATRLENFSTMIRLLRKHVPAAAYDERLLSFRKVPDPPNDLRASNVFDRETGGVDLLAHLLATWLSRRA